MPCPRSAASLARRSAIRWFSSTGVEGAAVFTVSVPAADMPLTPYTRYGDEVWYGVSGLAAAVLIGIWAALRRADRKQKALAAL